MKTKLISLVRVVSSILCIFTVQIVYAQNSVGIGIIDPNPNAVLELVSPDNNQGVLVPRMTTAQRTAPTFVDNLSSQDKGLLIFDTDTNGFHYWSGTNWSPVDTPETLQDLQLTGSTLRITNNPNASDISLAPFLGTNTDEQTLSVTGTSLNISNGNSVDISVVQDGFEPNTDNQTLNITGSSLSISGGNSINIGGIDTDNQTLSLSGTSLSIADGNSVNLSTINTDNQTLGLSGNTLSIAGGNNVNLNTIDNQTLSLSGANLSIAGGNTIDIGSIDTDTQLSEAAVDAFVANNGYLTTEADGSTTNEIQDLNLAGNILTITNNGSATPIDLSPFSGTNTDNQTISLSGTDLSIAGGNTIDIGSINTDTQLDEAAVDAFVGNNGYLTAEVDGSITNEIQNISTNGVAGNISITSGATLSLNVNDADANSTNEIQDLNLTGNILTITNNGSATPIDLSPFSGTNTDNQTISLSGTNLSIAGGNTIDISSIDTDTQLDETAVDAFVSNNGFLSAEVDGSITNEIQDLTFTAGVIALSNDPGSTTIDLSGYDNNVSDDFNGDFTALSNIPAGILDGDDVGITSVNHNTTLTGNGNGTPLGVNVGTAANQIVQLNASGQLPAINGSLLTGLPTSPWTGSPDISYTGGSVGVGTSSPFNQLSVSGTNNTPSASDGIMLDIQNISGISGALSGIRFKKNGVTVNQRFNSGIFYDGDDLMFSIKNNSTATNVSTNDVAMTLTNQGRVGIGTTAPGSQLTVSKNEGGSSATSLNILEASGTSDASLLFETQGGNAFSMGIDASDAHKFKVSTNNALGTNDRLTVIGAGNVGIGTSSPLTSYQLEIETTFTGGLYIDNNATSGNNYGIVTSMNSLASGTKYGFYSSGEDRNYFSGDVGVGTTAPSAKLDVVGTSELNGDVQLNANLVSAVLADHITGTNETLPTPTRRILRVTANTTNKGVNYIGAGQDGQELIIIHAGNGGSGFASAVILYRSGTGGAGITPTANSMYMSGGSTYNLYTGSSVHFIYDGVIQGWVEISRSENILAIN
ncbi:MAG: hypothetical protein WAU36_01980 [Cyclobacteriaceae bacterium]